MVPRWFFEVAILTVCFRPVLVNLTIHHCLCYYTLFEVSAIFGLSLYLDPFTFLFVVNRIFFEFPITFLKINVTLFALAFFLNAGSALELLYSFYISLIQGLKNYHH